MLPAWSIKLCATLVLLAAAWGHGYHHGVQRVQRKWDAQRLADQQAADAAREVDRLRARSAEAGYIAGRAAAAGRATTPSPEVRNALNAPICRPLGASAPGIRLGDVAVSAAVVGRLRDAGADY